MDHPLFIETQKSTVWDSVTGRFSWKDACIRFIVFFSILHALARRVSKRSQFRDSSIISNESNNAL